MTPDDNLTPAMKQFRHFKSAHPDAVLFFRMGDFYETFYEDAQICSQVLGLALTSRNKGPNAVPLAGVPYHAVDHYLKKMLAAGYKVAVCEQVEDPKLAKGVVKRDVVRIVTPGTLTDEAMLEDRQDNFLAAVWPGPKTAAMAWVDISTGHFFTRIVPLDKLVDELTGLAPREVLAAQAGDELFAAESRKLVRQIAQATGAAVTERPGWYFDPRSARQRLLKHFQLASLEGFGVADDFPIGPAGAILEYLNETQKTTLSHIRRLQKVEPSQFLQIDPVSLRSLEVLRTIRAETRRGTLLDCMDQTMTAMGGRMMRSWLTMPLCDIPAIEARQQAVETLVCNERACETIRLLLKSISDLERIVGRISASRCGPKDLLALGQSLRKTPALHEQLSALAAELLAGLGAGCSGMDELADLLEKAIDPQCASHLREGGVIAPGFDAELDRLRSIGKDGRAWLAQYQQQEIERTGIANLRVGYNKVFGYYIEINHTQSQKVPADYTRKQTIKNAERYVTEPLREYEQQALTAQDKAVELEQQLFEQLRRKAAEFTEPLQSLARCLATIDCLASFAFVARRRHYVRPQITDAKELAITDGKHPVLAESLGSEFVPNDTALGEGAGDLVILTGPNMAGKSTYIRQTALLVLLAQTGSFIPAQSARIGLVDRIFTRVGAADELLRGQSTFMVEMTETANILNNATDRSLVILDEVGRGTSTYDGLALAWAITEHLASVVKCRTLFATHYHQLTELAALFDNVRNCNVAVREWAGSVVFLHKITPGGTDKSYGIHVARLAGLPKSITARANEILADLESTFAREAAGSELSRLKTNPQDSTGLFSQAERSALDRLTNADVNRLTPIEAIQLLEQIQREITRQVP
ncbi:MAG: DNA mismatch repair protein MutS [Phycisphaerae bacterium]|nr:DNA mismatch repair protein MutS [Phycisphaerae bacterium]